MQAHRVISGLLDLSLKDVLKAEVALLTDQELAVIRHMAHQVCGMAITEQLARGNDRYVKSHKM